MFTYLDAGAEDETPDEIAKVGDWARMVFRFWVSATRLTR